MFSFFLREREREERGFFLFEMVDECPNDVVTTRVDSSTDARRNIYSAAHTAYYTHIFCRDGTHTHTYRTGMYMNKQK